MTAAAFGVYVHIPFCLRRCDYCAFATWDDRMDLVDRYVDGVALEIERAAASLPPASSVFFGGGTPSLLGADALAGLLARLPVAARAEVTVECNPDTVDLGKLAGYRRAGVNRISLGVQSMAPHVLGSLGRSHDPGNVRRAVTALREAGFDTFNVDLIYGAAGETTADWQRTLDDVLGLEPPHVSAYGLTVEAGTPLASDPARHPDDDDQADKYVMADEALTAAGLESYEISNWAAPGHECRHNLLYWSQGDYRGFGCAAHSHHDGRRWWNLRTPERYLEAVAAGRSTEAAAEHLDDDERRIEGLQLALRTRDGVPAAALPADDLGGLVAAEGERLVLTREGRLLANEVALRLR
jgi:putative oxygen-independent coproporphyrinogen III oxidase